MIKQRAAAFGRLCRALPASGGDPRAYSSTRVLMRGLGSNSAQDLLDSENTSSDAKNQLSIR